MLHLRRLRLLVTHPFSTPSQQSSKDAQKCQLRQRAERVRERLELGASLKLPEPKSMSFSAPRAGLQGKPTLLSVTLLASVCAQGWPRPRNKKLGSPNAGDAQLLQAGQVAHGVRETLDRGETKATAHSEACTV